MRNSIEIDKCGVCPECGEFIGSAEKLGEILEEFTCDHCGTTGDFVFETEYKHTEWDPDSYGFLKIRDTRQLELFDKPGEHPVVIDLGLIQGGNHECS